MNRHKIYDKYKRDEKSKKFYDSKEWEKARELALKKYYYLCQECLKRKIITPYDVVHHIVPLKESKELSLDIDNLLPLCHKCHNKIENSKQERKLNINVIEVQGNAEMV